MYWVVFQSLFGSQQRLILVTLLLSCCCCPGSSGPSQRTSVSSFHSVVDSDSAASINLNMEQNNVNFRIKKQSKCPQAFPALEQKCKHLHTKCVKVKGSFLISCGDRCLNDSKETSVCIWNHQFVVLMLSSLSVTVRFVRFRVNSTVKMQIFCK